MPARWLVTVAVLVALATIAFARSSGGAAPGSTERVSLDGAGVEGNAFSGYPAISADGRFVSFSSDATNLVSGDTNLAPDIFVHDRQTGSTERMSVDGAGSQANGSSYEPAIGADGRFVAFSSMASNLVAGDTNGTRDVFVHDRQTGATERVNVDSAGSEANAAAFFPAISGDGRFVAFSSDAGNLAPGDTNPASDVFVRDRQTGTTERASVNSAVDGAVGASYAPAVSSDGRFVAFTSAASNLVPADANGTTDIFVRDRQAGTTERASLNSAGSEGNGASDESAVSSDGRFVTFRSLSSNLVAGDTNSVDDVFLHDRQTGTTGRMSVDSAGAQGNATSRVPAVSGDGRFVAFRSLASNLVAADTNGAIDVFVHDSQTGITVRVSVDSAGSEGSGPSDEPAVSGD